MEDERKRTANTVNREKTPNEEWPREHITEQYNRRRGNMLQNNQEVRTVGFHQGAQSWQTLNSSGGLTCPLINSMTPYKTLVK